MNHDLPPVTSWVQAVNDTHNVTHNVTYAGAANSLYTQEGYFIMKGAVGPNAEVEPLSHRPSQFYCHSFGPQRSA